MENKDNTGYGEYLELVKQKVEVKTGKRVQLHTIRKNNGLLLDGLTILSEETNVSPTIYLNGYYEEFLTNGIEEVTGRIIAFYEANKAKESFDISIVTDISKVKSFIKMKLINYEKNKTLLEEVPHIKVLDLAIVFMITLEKESSYGFGTIQINKQFLKGWGITEDELYRIAKENMANDFETVALENILSAVLGETLQEDWMEESVFSLYVLTNHYKIHGAIGMLQTELLDAFMQKYQMEKLIILPSSVHEVLLVSYEIAEDGMDFGAMVREVNETQVTEEEFLSNNIYVYDGKTLEIFNE